jgi:hypothetical protein
MHLIDPVQPLHWPAFLSNFLVPDCPKNMTIALLILLTYSRSSQACSAEDTVSNDVVLALGSGRRQHWRTYSWPQLMNNSIRT